MKLIQKPFICVCAGLILAVFFVSCAKPPTEEMNKAIEAVTRAENDNDAVTYAGNSLDRARDALKRMQSEASSKRYDAAKSFANEAITAAERAISEGRAGATRARDDASAIVSMLPPLIAETEQGINAARTAGLPLDFDVVNSDFNTACGKADQAQAALNNSRYQEAIDQGRAARSDLNGINQQLSTATMAVSRKK